MNWSPTDREIFAYVDPEGKKRYEDPLVVLRGLQLLTRGKLDELIDKQAIMDTDNPIDPVIRAEAEDKLISAVRNMFKLPPIDGVTGIGVTDTYCIRLLQHFCDYIDEKKANTGD